VEELHRTLVGIGFDAGEELGLVLAGGYAMTAHSLVERPSRDVDFATATSLPLPLVADRVAAAYRAAGFEVVIVEATERMARLSVTANVETCEVDILKEAIGPPAHLAIGPVLALPDAVGLKLRALADRAAHRDFIDVYAARHDFSPYEMENLLARHSNDVSVEDLADRLGAVGYLDDDDFRAYGMDSDQVAAMRRWAHNWESDIRARLAAGTFMDDNSTVPDLDWYLDGA
jgi:hypothetical protein